MRFFINIWLGLALPTALWAQGTGRVSPFSNVKTEVTPQQALLITYDIVGNKPSDSVYFEVRSYSRPGVAPRRQSVQGDVGTNVPPGTNRRIFWDARADNFPLDGTFSVIMRSRPTLGNRPAPSVAQRPAPTNPPATTLPGATLPGAPAPGTPSAPPADRPSQPAAQPTTLPSPATTLPTEASSRSIRKPGGPAFAMLSLIAPGVGNIFVQTPRPRVGLRPLVTASFYGLVAYGLIERQRSLTEYALYEQQRNAEDAEPFYQRANAHHRRYYIATRAAGAIWITDVVATLIRGMGNQRLYNEAQRRATSARVGTQAGVPVAVVRYRF